MSILLIVGTVVYAQQGQSQQQKVPIKAYTIEDKNLGAGLIAKAVSVNASINVLDSSVTISTSLYVIDTTTNTGRIQQLSKSIKMKTTDFSSSQVTTTKIFARVEALWGIKLTK